MLPLQARGKRNQTKKATYGMTVYIKQPDEANPGESGLVNQGTEEKQAIGRANGCCEVSAGDDETFQNQMIVCQRIEDAKNR